jgi:hypothetical protein
LSLIDRRFRLADGVGSLGLSCTATGAWLAGVPLLRMTVAGLAPRPGEEIDALMKAAYGQGVDATRLSPGLAVVAEALNRGDLGRAMVAAVRLRLPELSGDAAARIARADQNLIKYNPDEPRDWRGRWTTGGEPDPRVSVAPNQRTTSDHGVSAGNEVASSGSAETAPIGSSDSESSAATGEVNPETLTPAAYNGRFHDQAVAEYAAVLRSKGEIVQTEVRLRMADGSAGARLDILAFDPLSAITYGVEVKTGANPGFTPGQLVVYPHLMWGGAVVALDGKVLAVGISPNVPLQPIPIFL